MKKLFLFVLAMALLLNLTGVAMASSPDVSDLTDVVYVQTQTGTQAVAPAPNRTRTNTYSIVDPDVPLAGWSIFIVEDETSAIFNKRAEELARINEFLTAGNHNIAEYYNVETNENLDKALNANVSADIIAKLPAGFDVSTLNMNEFVAAGVRDYDETVGDAEVALVFATQYRDGQNLVGVVSYFDANDAMIVQAVGATAVTENGVQLVKLQFPQALLSTLNNGDFLLGILSEP